ncbi:MAG: universal stress protein [Candidatus Sumerlaeia bacterium]
MIRAITVRAGSSKYTKAAQDHAIALAQAFNARLRIVLAWEGRADEEKVEHQGASSAENAGTPDVDELMLKARQAGITVEEGYRGEGTEEGMVAESRSTDLIVLGLPTEDEANMDRDAGILMHSEKPILRKAESSLLAVQESPRDNLNCVLAIYEGGVEGKGALRMAAHIAEKQNAKVAVLTRMGRIEDATLMASAAKRYLKNYDLPGVQILDEVGNGASRGEILNVAKKVDAGLIVIGSDPYGLMKVLFDIPIAEKTILDTHIPVLIAR